MLNQQTFDRYQTGHSQLHQLDPRVKVVGTLALIIANVLLPDGAWAAFALTWIVILALDLLAGFGGTYALRRSVIVLPFALIALTVVTAVPGRPLAEWVIGTLRIVPTDAGVVRFVSILIRSWLSIQFAILLVATTRFPDLMHALRHIYVPKLLIAIVSFMYRYLSVLSDEVTRLLRARDARSAQHGDSRYKSGGSVLWRARVAGHMAGQLFLRSYERSERVYNAMLARGYSGYLQTMRPHTMRRSDWLAVGIIVALLVTIQVVGRIVTR
jgi:cobalt/nickel transport system permease protein